MGVTLGVTTFSEENPELAKLATAAATAPLASKLEITSEPKRTARGYKAGDVFETKDTRGRPNRFQVMSDPETGRLFTKKVAKDVPLKGTPVTGPAKPLTVGKALGDVGDKLKPLAQVLGVTTAGKVLKAVPVAGQAAQAFFTYAEFTTVKDKAEAQIRSLPDSKDLTDEQIDMLASDIATRSAAASLVVVSWMCSNYLRMQYRLVFKRQEQYQKKVHKTLDSLVLVRQDLIST